jgi:hypothetical protein
MGLGVYDSTSTLVLECGARNERRGADAAGGTAGHTIDAGGAQVLAAPPRLEATIRAMDGRQLGGFTVEVSEARPANAFICNETHHRALSATRLCSGRLAAAYFVHLPYPAEGDATHERLAEGVSELIAALVLVQLQP